MTRTEIMSMPERKVVEELAARGIQVESKLVAWIPDGHPDHGKYEVDIRKALYEASNPAMIRINIDKSWNDVKEWHDGL